jgi:hypothetical protein
MNDPTMAVVLIAWLIGRPLCGAPVHTIVVGGFVDWIYR